MAPELEQSPSRVVAADAASFGQRFLARLVDGLVTLAPQLLVFAAIDGYGRILVAGLLEALYEIPQLAWWGRTVGKRALGIRVVTTDGRAATPSWAQAFVRVMLPDALFLSPSDAIAGVAPLWWLAVYLPMLFDPWRRGVHDRAAGTRVVRDA